MGKQQVDGGLVIELGGNHQCCAAPIVPVVDMRAAVEQQIHHLDDIVDAGFVGVASCPHQRRQIMAIVGVDVDPVVEQQLHDRGKPFARRIDDRSFLCVVDGIGVSSFLEQQHHDRVVAHEGAGGERRYSSPPRYVYFRAALHQ